MFTHRKRPYLAILLISILILAYALRLHNLTAFSFWTDEGLTPLRASYPLSTILSNQVTIQEGITTDTHPPLYFLLIHITRQLFGETDFAYRYPSVLSGLLLVPLLFQLGRRLKNWQLGLATAVLTAINPLQIWYAHEARMYTLLVLLMAAATYLLWRAIQGSRHRALLPLYLLTAFLAFYTHYTAIFLLALHGLFWLRIFWQRGQRRLILLFIGLATLAAIPLIPYTIPRLFTGAEANYNYVSPLIMLQDVVHFFSLGLSTDFSQPLIKLLDIGILLLLILGTIAARPTSQRLLLVGYLLTTVFGLMAGSVIKPMYQGVRHIMIGSPALMLLCAHALIYLIAQWRRPNPAFWRLATAVALTTTLLGPAIALTNLYTNPSFAKDDYRSLIRYIESQAGPNDIIIYNNAIQLPVHQQYQQRSDIAVTALPVYPYTATGTEPELAQYAATYDRIWFTVEPPADKRDDNHLIEGWLDDHLLHIDTTTSHARTTVIATKGYATAVSNLNHLPDSATPLTISAPGYPQLIGWEPNFTTHAVGPTLWLNLFWDGPWNGPTAIPNQPVTFQLIAPDGREWLHHDANLDSTVETPWPTSPVIRRPYRLPLPDGLPPGSYQLTIQLGDSSHTLGTITTAPASDWPLPGTRPAPTRQLTFANTITLDSYLPDQTVRPGHNLPLALYWHTGTADIASTSTLSAELTVTGPDGTVIRTQTDPIAPGWLTQPPANSPLTQFTGLYFPPDTAPGQYKVALRLLENGAPINGRSPWQPWSTAQNTLTTITVAPWPLRTEPPTDTTPVNATLGSAIQLHSYRIDQPDPHTLTVTLVWHATAVPTENLLVFLHLTAPDGSIARQIDTIPVNGLRPTSGWRSGEYLIDTHTFTDLDTLPPGTYTLNTGLFNPDTFQRPTLSINGQPLPNNQFPLTTTLTLP